MGVNVTGPGLMKEVNAWKAKNASVHTRWERVVNEYHSPAFKADSIGTSSPENYRFTFTLHTTARNMAGRPRVRLSSRNRAAEPRITEFENMGDAWLQDSHFDETLQYLIAGQCLTDHAVAMVSQRPRRGFEEHDDPPMTPAVTLIPSEQFGYDVYAQKMRSARLQFHAVIAPKDEVLKDALADPEGGWDVVAIAALTEDAVTKDYRKDPTVAVPRGEIVYYEIWVPGHELEEMSKLDPAERKKFHGTVFCISAPDGIELKKPRPYFGPPEGPYCVRGTMVVPGEARFLSMLTAAEGQIEQCNAQARANDEAETQRKAFAVIDAATDEAKVAIVSVKQGETLVIPGLSQNPNAVQMVQVGGMPPEAHAREIDLRQRVERNLAMGDATQGQASGVGTATENVIASRAAANVASLVDGGIEAQTADIVRHALWFFDQDHRSAMVVDGNVITGGNTYEEKKAGIQHALANQMVSPEEAQQAIAELEQIEGPQGTLDDLDVTVESVRADPAEEARLVSSNNFLLQWAPLAPAIAAYCPGAKKFFERAATGLRVPEVAEFFDFDAAAKVFEEQQAAAQAETEARSQPAPAAPRTIQAQQKPQANKTPLSAAKGAA